MTNWRILPKVAEETHERERRKKSVKKSRLDLRVEGFKAGYPEHAANVEAIKARKAAEKELKALQGERVVIARQLAQAENALTVATGRQSAATIALNKAMTVMTNSMPRSESFSTNSKPRKRAARICNRRWQA
jgi:hypothetical protein